jgi:hypothetical protein
VMKRSSMISFYLVSRMREEAVGWIWYVYMRVGRGNQAPSIGILVKASSIGLERKREWWWWWISVLCFLVEVSWPIVSLSH